MVVQVIPVDAHIGPWYPLSVITRSVQCCLVGLGQGGVWRGTLARAFEDAGRRTDRGGNTGIWTVFYPAR
jgi:hypothetical protein